MKDTHNPDPYRGTDWYPERVHQLAPTADSVCGDRRADRILVDPRFGRLIDTAVEAGTPLQDTTGHWPDDRHPPRRVDRIYGTHHLRGRVTGFHTIITDEAKRSSHHLPVLAHIDLHDLG